MDCIIPQSLTLPKSTDFDNKSDTNSGSPENGSNGGEVAMDKTIDLKYGTQLIIGLNLSFQRRNSRSAVLCMWIIVEKSPKKNNRNQNNRKIADAHGMTLTSRTRTVTWCAAVIYKL